MSRIGEAFAHARAAGRVAFIPYLTAGDPSEDRTRDLVLTLERSGADIVELGVPFSDPLADGEVNQRAAQRALGRGTSLSRVLAIASRIRQDSRIPLVLFTYVNPVLRMGFREFAARASAAGVDGVLATDLPVEEAGEYRRALESAGIDPVFLLAPTTQPGRLRTVGEASRGFIYYISRTGVTGEREAIPPEVRARVGEIRRMSGKPVAVGFGISRREHLEEVASFADGVVVGSAIMKWMEQAGDRPDLPEFLASRVATLLPAVPPRRG